MTIDDNELFNEVVFIILLIYQIYVSDVHLMPTKASLKKKAIHWCESKTSDFIYSIWCKTGRGHGMLSFACVEISGFGARTNKSIHQLFKLYIVFGAKYFCTQSKFYIFPEMYEW